MPTEVRRVFGQAQWIGATEQHQKDANQIQYFALGDGHLMFLSEHLMDLRHRPPFPKSPVANLNDHFQSKATAAHCQSLSRLRSIDPLMPGAFRMRTPVAHADHQVTPIQKDHVFSPERITAFQAASATPAGRFFWPIVTLGHIAIVFGSSHRHTSLVRSSWKSRFYSARGM
jgi:hypothetical protein